jgi:signal transduction histidine kinase
MRLLGSITNRIFLASALLATLTIGAAVSFVSVRLTLETEAELQRDLTEAATLVDWQQRVERDNVARTARLIADLPRFKAAVDLGDRVTMKPIADEYQQQADADLLVVTSRYGEELAVAGDDAMRGAVGDAVGDGVPGWRFAAPSPITFWPHASGVIEIVSVPIAVGLDRPDLLGTLTLGRLLDQGRAEEIKQITGADIAFAIGGRVRASTFGPGAEGSLATLIGSTGPARVAIGGGQYVALARPLGVKAGADQATALILRSRTERMRTLAAIQRALGGIALAAVLLAVVLSYGVARTISRPLATITDHMRQLAATGDLTRKIATPGPGAWGDEDARMLATTFNALTESVAGFQREAALRERLSSLGRLSTVIAHEVRNPLMIIKGALRTLARDHATPADIRDAGEDINQEIDRLSRLVDDVLDVARPIHIEPTPTDVNAVCRAAAAAAGANPVSASIALDLASALPTVMADAERLRTVLVNLLTNAQHAVDTARISAPRPAAAPARRGDASEADVRLVTERIGDRRVAVSVHDAGPGIADDDLPRIFDPYFTTRRAGTGLGLAIAKNIVEALGGTIAVTTRPGRGSSFRIELGDSPAAGPPAGVSQSGGVASRASQRGGVGARPGS